MKLKKHTAPPARADNGMSLAVARCCPAGGPLERFKLGDVAKEHLIRTLKVSTSSHGRRELLKTRKPVDPKTCDRKQKNRLRKDALKKQQVAERRQKRKEAKRAAKQKRRSSRRV